MGFLKWRSYYGGCKVSAETIHFQFEKLINPDFLGVIEFVGKNQEKPENMKG